MHMHTYYSYGCVLNINAASDLPPPLELRILGRWSRCAVSWFVVNTDVRARARLCHKTGVLNYPDGTTVGNIIIMEHLFFRTDRRSAA